LRSGSAKTSDGGDGRDRVRLRILRGGRLRIVFVACLAVFAACGGAKVELVPPPADAIPLTEGEWADGEITETVKAQWFRFTATAIRQYVHVSFGSLRHFYARMYNSIGEEQGAPGVLLQGGTTNFSRTLAISQEYSIWLSPSPNFDTGTYQITFSASSNAPVANAP